MANVHHATEFPFLRFALVDETLSIEVATADSAGELDFDAIAGCELWSVRGKFEDCECCVAWVDQRGCYDRTGHIRELVATWLCGLEQSKRLYAVDVDGLRFPELRVGKD